MIVKPMFIASNKLFPNSLIIFILLLSILSPGAVAETYFTSFEGLGSGDFSIGDSPITATFSGGEVVAAGIPENYRTGAYSWRVFAFVPATISFETPASEVELYFRNPEGTGPSQVIVYDVNDAILLQVEGTNVFQQVKSSRQANDTLIDRVVINNSSTEPPIGGDPYYGGGSGSTGGGDIMVDDVTFTAQSSTAQTPSTESVILLIINSMD